MSTSNSAAVYLEFKYFLPELLPIYFPGLRDPERVEAVLAHDVDAPTWYEQTRLAGAAGPTPPASMSPPTSRARRAVHLERPAKRASRAGNNVSARPSCVPAGGRGIAPAALTLKKADDQLVAADLDQLGRLLRATL